jgi:hypothetical protein
MLILISLNGLQKDIGIGSVIVVHRFNHFSVEGWSEPMARDASPEGMQT